MQSLCMQSLQTKYLSKAPPLTLAPKNYFKIYPQDILRKHWKPVSCFTAGFQIAPNNYFAGKLLQNPNVAWTWIWVLLLLHFNHHFIQNFAGKLSPNPLVSLHKVLQMALAVCWLNYPLWMFPSNWIIQHTLSLTVAGTHNPQKHCNHNHKWSILVPYSTSSWLPTISFNITQLSTDLNPLAVSFYWLWVGQSCLAVIFLKRDWGRSTECPNWSTECPNWSTGCTNWTTES